MKLYVMLAPHLVNRGAGNTAWIGDYKGLPVLLAQGGGSALALVTVFGISTSPATLGQQLTSP